MGTSGEVDTDDNLETVIARSGGDLSRSFAVVRNGIPAGMIGMQDIFKALIPRDVGQTPAPAGPERASGSVSAISTAMVGSLPRVKSRES